MRVGALAPRLVSHPNGFQDKKNVSMAEELGIRFLSDTDELIEMLPNLQPPDSVKVMESRERLYAMIAELKVRFREASAEIMKLSES